MRDEVKKNYSYFIPHPSSLKTSLIPFSNPFCDRAFHFAQMPLEEMVCVTDNFDVSVRLNRQRGGESAHFVCRAELVSVAVDEENRLAA